MEFSIPEFGMQLAIVVVVFFISTTVLFSKLKEVIVEREEKTVLMEKDAEERMQKAGEVAEAYRAKIDIAYGQAQKTLKLKKDEILQKENTVFKEEEKVISGNMEKEREQILKDVEAKRAEAFKHADALSSDLVNKIIG